MSLSPLLCSLKQLLFPTTCPICGKVLQEVDDFVCLHCSIAAPFTQLWRTRNNIMEARFDGVVPIERAAALLWFSSGSAWRAVIHDFKYNSHWYYAENLGRWLASVFSEGDFFEGIDMIIPVPLHWSRRFTRGYNQSEHIAAGISHVTSIPYNFKAIRRNRNNPPQAKRKFYQRWDNISTLFSITHPEKLVGRHILLVDDVFTSGATLITLARTIVKACNGDVKISIATFAASQHLRSE
ncbi:MAG: ComF family protein [Alistipes sp.]|nr:ComF family protein [Alistipes sp.]